jgi:hypothetical protein
MKTQSSGKRLGWLTERGWFIFGITCAGFSTGLYAAFCLQFRDLPHIYLCLVGYVSFIPIEVTLIIHRMPKVRKQREMLNKLNMVTGVFFSGAWQKLLGLIVSYDPKREALSRLLKVSWDWDWTNPFNSEAEVAVG